MTHPTPSNEFERLIELTEMDLDYTSLQDELSDLVLLAAHIAGVKVSLINLIDTFTQWTVADHGLEVDQMPREDSVCQYTIMEDEPLEVKNLKNDERFQDKEYVSGEPGLRYYYGIPLITSAGYNIGSLCVLDNEQKVMSPEKEELMSMIANQIVRRLSAMKKIKDLTEQVDDLKSKSKKVSHDIRNPIAGIVGIADLMEEEIKNEQINELLDLVKMIKKGGNNLLELIEEIMAHEESGTKTSSENKMNCEMLCSKLDQLYMPQAKAKGVKLNISATDESGKISIPVSRLLQIIGNLISNSIKFTGEGGSVDVVIGIESEDAEAGNRLRVEVSDTGVGMSEEKIEEIVSGEAVSEAGTTGEKGYGFGLSLVEHLIEKANGTMQIDSEPGKGTHFLLKIPLAAYS